MKWIIGVSATAVLIGVLAAMTVPAQTITLDEATLKLFPPETEGVASIDVSGLRGSSLFNELVLRNASAMQDHLSEFAQATGFDVQRDVDKVTVGRIGTNDVLVIVQARYDKFKVEQFLQDKAEHINTETYLGRVIYSGSAKNEHEGGVSFIDNLIIAGSLPAVHAAIDRLAAPAPSVLDNSELMSSIHTIEVGNQVWAAGKFDSNMFGQAQSSNKGFAQIVGSLKSGIYEMRFDQDLHVKASGVFASSDMAKATTQMLNGLLAMGKVQLSQDPKLTHLLDGVSINNSGDRLTVSFNAPGDLLKQLPQKRWAARAAH